MTSNEDEDEDEEDEDDEESEMSEDESEDEEEEEVFYLLLLCLFILFHFTIFKILGSHLSFTSMNHTSSFIAESLDQIFTFWKKKCKRPVTQFLRFLFPDEKKQVWTS